jgi:hypothetical protein
MPASELMVLAGIARRLVCAFGVGVISESSIVAIVTLSGMHLDVMED